ncbi:DUF3310 domain-containing protein [Macrococcoides caseolyticum]|uniref:DUF3310 domain-containing protein n=1 Tax=Macrococcus caseolyticus (strain JCSC5402) TaxID=458233 RepID=B9EBL3_MACCJ|nr:DUF3310 domain-containing protein [Macrococcus caseolyticus]BAH17624.1 hypothetical protein MCCL_0917 [Macrococcus caseolyticus JCSC5402]
MRTTLKGLTVEEVDKVIFNTKNMKEAANEIGVAYQSLLQFRSENMKEFKKLKAQREQGLIFDEAPVIKTKPVKGASQIPIVETIEKSEYDKLLDQVKELEEKIIEKNLEIKQLEKDKKKAISDRETFEKDATAKLKKLEKVVEDRVDNKVKNLNSQLEKHKDTIEKISEVNRNLQETVKQANLTIKEYQDKETEMVLNYEEQLKEKVAIIKNLENELSSSQQSEKVIDIINKAGHYNYGDIEVIDFIEQVIEHYPSVVANSIANVIKYVARAPHKNDVQDLEKAQYYIKRAIDKTNEKIS